MAQRRNKNKFSQKNGLEKRAAKKNGDANSETKVSPFFRHAVLLVVSIILVLLIRNLPMNKRWEETRFNRFVEEKELYGANMDSTFRSNLVNGGVAGILKFLSENMEEKDAIFLLPPQEFLVEEAYQANNPNEFFFWTSPSSFKNHSLGKINFVLATHPDSLVQKADYTFWPHNKDLTLLKLDNQEIKDSVINVFRTKRQHVFFSATQAREHLKNLERK